MNILLNRLIMIYDDRSDIYIYIYIYIYLFKYVINLITFNESCPSKPCCTFALTILYTNGTDSMINEMHNTNSRLLFELISLSSFLIIYCKSSCN